AGGTGAIGDATGQVLAGEGDVVDSATSGYIAEGLEAALEVAANDDIAELVPSVDRRLTHADATRRMAVRANADTGQDAARARERGAQGIGLCRTEHQFLGERRKYVEALVLAGTSEEEDAALEALLPIQRDAFEELLDAMDGLPVTIRLLDPPLHEFLPDLVETSVEVALAKERGEDTAEAEKLLSALQQIHEANPMLGLRGVRLGLKMEGLYRAQIRAIIEATQILREQE